MITLANHKRHGQYSEPIKTQNNYMWLTQSVGKQVRMSYDWFWFYFWSDEKLARDFLSQSHRVVIQNQLLFDTQMRTTLVMINNDNIKYFFDDNNIIASDWCKHILWTGIEIGEYYVHVIALSSDWYPKFQNYTCTHHIRFLSQKMIQDTGHNLCLHWKIIWCVHV